MTLPPDHERRAFPIFGVLAAAVLLVVGLYPLPLRTPGGATLVTGNAGYWLGASLLVIGPVLALATLPLERLHALPARLGRVMRRPTPLVFAVLAGVAFTGLAVGVAWYAFSLAPTTSDAIAQLWHARILLHGRVTLPVDSNFEFFAANRVIDHGAWYSPFPIGGPLVLTLGYLMHAPWLLGPVLGGFSAVALYHFTRRAYGEAQARAAALLFMAAPATLLMSASYRNHAPTLLLAVATLAGLTEWDRAVRRARRIAIAAAMGLAVGFMAAIRPLDAAAVGIVVLGFQVWTSWHAPRRRWEPLVLVGFAVVGAVPLALGDLATTGSAFRLAGALGQSVADRAAGSAVTPSPLHALAGAAAGLSGLNALVVGWPLPALAVIAIGLLSMGRASRWDAVLVALLFAQLAAYAIGGNRGTPLQATVLYTAVPTVIIFLARTPFLVAERWGGYWRHAAPLAVLTAIAAAWLLPMGPFGAQAMVRQAHDARGAYKVDLADATRAAGIHHAIVFVHVPFGERLVRQLRAVGFTRSTAAGELEHGDACSVLQQVQWAEHDTMAPSPALASAVAARIATYAPGAAPVHAVDPAIRISSDRSLTPECRSELAFDERYGAMPFAPALLLEPIDADGRLDGDVIYAADLGEHNDVLRARFGGRAWYRAWVERTGGGRMRAVVGPY